MTAETLERGKLISKRTAYLEKMLEEIDAGLKNYESTGFEIKYWKASGRSYELFPDRELFKKLLEDTKATFLDEISELKKEFEEL